MNSRLYRGKRTGGVRDKRTGNGPWLFGSLIALDDDCTLIVPPYNSALLIVLALLISLRAETVDSDTVGQHIDILDKNGTEIFEGDIVKVHDTLKRCDEPYHEFVGMVDFADGSFVIRDGCVTNYRWMDYEVEVIGNRWDNPELLPEVLT